MENNYDDVFKIVVVGESLVGKTCLLSTYIPSIREKSTSKSQYNDFEAKSIVLKSGEIVDVQVWDLSGQAEFREIAGVYYTGADGILIVYDLTNENSFVAVQDWLDDVKSQIDCKNILLVGNKLDLCDENPSSRKVPKANALAFAEKHGLEYVETSALWTADVSKVFEKVLEKIGSPSQEHLRSFTSNRILFWLAVVIIIVLTCYQIV